MAYGPNFSIFLCTSVNNIAFGKFVGRPVDIGPRIFEDKISCCIILGDLCGDLFSLDIILYSFLLDLKNFIFYFYFLVCITSKVKTLVYRTKTFSTFKSN